MSALDQPTPAERWHHLVAGAVPGAGVEAMTAMDALVARYREPHRRYHGVAHLAAVLRTLDELLATEPASPAVRFAAWFHDAVYDPTAPAGANEAASAELAGEVLGMLGAPPAMVADVRALILATAVHQPVAVAQCAALLDADLSVLGGTAEAYERYAAGIRFEYGHLDDASYRAGRAAVLQRFLDRPRLYFSAAGAARFEAAARRNLLAELARLTLPA